MNEIDQYIQQFPDVVQMKLQEMRAIILSAVPNLTEVISYKMPAYKQHTILVYFAGYKNHIGFYPTSSGISNFTNEFERYKFSKGAVQFPIDKPLPKALIRKIVKFRAKDDINRLKIPTRKRSNI